MFGIGMPELLVIFVIALLVFGPQELPKIGRTIGKAMGELRRASDDLKDGIQREMDAVEREALEREAAEREAAERAREAAAVPPSPPEPAPATTAAASPEVAQSGESTPASPAPGPGPAVPPGDIGHLARADDASGESHTPPPGEGPAPAIPADRPAGHTNA